MILLIFVTKLIFILNNCKIKINKKQKNKIKYIFLIRTII